MSQIALPLAPRSRNDPARIVLGSANRHVAEALQDAERWPFRTAVLTGPPRSGKSLLARWFEGAGKGEALDDRSEEHTSELQSRENLVCRLLLEKKKEPV